MKVRAGIDPGKNGYICLSVDGELIFHDIPKVGKEVDLHALNKLFYNLYDESKGDDVHFVIEDVHAVFGSAAGNTFTFGWCVGILEAFLTSYDFPFTKVQPKKWQKFCWEGIKVQKKPSSTGKTQVNDTKKTSILAAKRLFPNVDLRHSERAKNPHDGKVDSLLLCYYCSKNF